MKERHSETLPLIFEMEEPEKLAPAQLDRYLSQGWDRDAEFLFRQNVTLLNGEICSVVPLRVELDRYSPSKSQQKILRKCKAFTFEVKPLEIDAEKEALYRKHRVRFKEFVRTSLKDFFYRYANQSDFPTWELCVYDQNKLIAASFIDVGVNSIYSIYGMFDPAYSSFSLGKCTMLLELDFCQRTNRKFYYPGHAVDKSSIYDYKMSFSGMQFFDWKGHWKPMQTLAEEKTFVRVLERKLEEARRFFLKKLGLNFMLEQNREFFNNVWELLGIQKSGSIHGPLFLFFDDSYQGFSVEFRPDQGHYALYLGRGLKMLFWGTDLEQLGKALQKHRKKIEGIRQLQSFRLIEIETLLSITPGMAERLSLIQSSLSVENMLCLFCQGDKNRYTIEYSWSQDKYFVYITLAEQNQRHVFHFATVQETLAFLLNSMGQEQRDLLQIQQYLSKDSPGLELEITYHRSDFYAVSQLSITDGKRIHILKYSIPDQLYVLEVNNSTSLLYFIKETQPHRVSMRTLSLITHP